MNLLNVNTLDFQRNNERRSAYGTQDICRISNARVRTILDPFLSFVLEHHRRTTLLNALFFHRHTNFIMIDFFLNVSSTLPFQLLNILRTCLFFHDCTKRCTLTLFTIDSVAKIAHILNVWLFDNNDHRAKNACIFLFLTVSSIAICLMCTLVAIHLNRCFRIVF